MKALKVLAVAAVFGCYVFGSAGVSAQQICPVGGGACVTPPGPAPASSYSNARSVDIMIRQPVPVVPTAQSLLPEILPLLPTARGTLTTGVLTGTLVNSGSAVTYFCVAGQGIDLWIIVNWIQQQHLACPTGSGAIVLSTEALSPGM